MFATLYFMYYAILQHVHYCRDNITTVLGVITFIGAAKVSMQQTVFVL
jgi:hypothetical protein